MSLKLFKIGEYAIGGIIKAQYDKDNDEVTLTALDWDTNKPVRASESSDDLGYIQNVLWDWTSSYHADNVIEWLQAQGFNK